MLKIRDDIDLKELEKFYQIIYNDYHNFKDILCIFINQPINVKTYKNIPVFHCQSQFDTGIKLYCSSDKMQHVYELDKLEEQKAIKIYYDFGEYMFTNGIEIYEEWDTSVRTITSTFCFGYTGITDKKSNQEMKTLEADLVEKVDE